MMKLEQYIRSHASEFDVMEPAPGHEDRFLSRLEDALDACDYDTASDMQLAAQASIEKLEKLYATYRKNILD